MGRRQRIAERKAAPDRGRSPCWKPKALLMKPNMEAEKVKNCRGNGIPPAAVRTSASGKPSNSENRFTGPQTGKPGTP